MSAQAQANRKTWVQFKLNYPERVILKSLEAKACYDFNNKPQVCYLLMDGRKMYCSNIVQGQIERLKIQPGEPIAVRKFRAPDGHNIGWEVKRTNEGQPAAQFLNGESLEEYGEALAERHLDQLQSALEATITACAAAEKHGQSIGYQIRFAPGDIRAMAISKLIGMQQRGFGNAA